MADAKSDAGTRRLHDEKDYVRQEVSNVLARGIPVIPVLVGNAVVPKESELPANMERLALIQAVRIPADRGFHRGIVELVERIHDATDLPYQSMSPQQERGPEAGRIFLCHSSGDKEAVRKLYQRLLADRFNPWLDEQDLLPGQEWDLEIARAVRSSAVVLVCLSRSAVNKAGYVQKEIKYALDVAAEQPEGAIFMIPVRLEECDVPDRLKQWQWVDVFGGLGYSQIVKALVQKGLGPTKGSAL